MVPVRGRYLGPALGLPVTVVLPTWSLATYCEDPVGLWAGIGSPVIVRTVPGIERMMLRQPVVTQVAALMAGVTSGPRPSGGRLGAMGDDVPKEGFT